MPKPLRFKLRPGHVEETQALQAICDWDNSFFKTPRLHMRVTSQRPDEATVQREGDWSRSWWVRQFFNDTIDLSLQVDKQGCVRLRAEDMKAVRRYENPLRDPLLAVKRDNKFALRDGFHRLLEAVARGYRGRVWTVDMDDDESDTD